MAHKKRIVAVVGSLRRDSFNLQLARLVEQMIGERAEFHILDYYDVPMFNQDIEHPAPESVALAREIVESADGLWFFSPEYNASYSGALKNLLDWLSRPRLDKPALLVGKCAAMSGVSRGMSGTLLSQSHLTSLLSMLNLKIMNSPKLAIANVATQLDEEGKLALTTSREFLEKQVEAFLRFLEVNA